MDVLEPAGGWPVELQTWCVEDESGLVELGRELVGQDTVPELGRVEAIDRPELPV